jgi:hypothetical protein
MSTYRPLSNEEITRLEAAGCRASEWADVQVGDGFDPGRVHRVQFSGQVRLGALRGQVALEGDIALPAEIADATLIDCVLGDDVRVCNVRGYLARYQVGDGACVSDVGVIATRPGATFGNGVEAEAINEGGGREVPFFAELSSQFAYLYGLYRYRPALIARLKTLVEDYTAAARADIGTIGQNARVEHVGEIFDVAIGDYALVRGATRLETAPSSASAKPQLESVPGSRPRILSSARAPASKTACCSATLSSARACSWANSSRRKTRCFSPIARASTARPARSSPVPTP